MTGFTATGHTNEGKYDINEPHPPTISDKILNLHNFIILFIDIQHFKYKMAQYDPTALVHLCKWDSIINDNGERMLFYAICGKEDCPSSHNYTGGREKK